MIIKDTPADRMYNKISASLVINYIPSPRYLKFFSPEQYLVSNVMTTLHGVKLRYSRVPRVNYGDIE